MNEKAYELLVKSIANYLVENKVGDGKIMSLLEHLKFDVVEEVVKNRDGLYVMKKKGWLEAFNEEKLMANVATASDDIKQSLTESELTLMVKMLKDKIKESGKKVVPTVQIMNYVEEILMEMGHEKVCDYYRVFNA